MNEPVLARLKHLMSLSEEVEGLSAGVPWHPEADWQDQGTHLALYLDVPGVALEHLLLEEEEGRLTIVGERAAPENLLSAERPRGSFRRSLTFPQAVKPKSGQAQLQQGVLVVRFNKLHPTIDVGGNAELEEGTK